MNITETLLISTAEVAEMTGRDKTTINRWAAKGKLTPVYKGEGIRGENVFNRADVEKLIERENPTRK